MQNWESKCQKDHGMLGMREVGHRTVSVRRLGRVVGRMPLICKVTFTFLPRWIYHSLFSFIFYMLRDSLPMPRSVKYIIFLAFCVFHLTLYVKHIKWAMNLLFSPKAESSMLFVGNLASLFCEGPFWLTFYYRVRPCFRISLLYPSWQACTNSIKYLSKSQKYHHDCDNHYINFVSVIFKQYWNVLGKHMYLNILDLTSVNQRKRLS